MEPDELAELTQSVVYSLLEVMGKEYEEISKEKALKLEIISEKIVKKVRKSHPITHSTNLQPSVYFRFLTA